MRRRQGIRIRCPGCATASIHSEMQPSSRRWTAIPVIGRSPSLRKTGTRPRSLRIWERFAICVCCSGEKGHRPASNVPSTSSYLASDSRYASSTWMMSSCSPVHAKHLDTVWSLLRSAGISLKLKKCSFFQPKVHYLGHVISPGKLSVAEAAADAFRTFTFPRTLTQVRSFLGACNVYLRFVKRFAKIGRPLTDMTRANDWRPVGYWSYSLSDSEHNYSATKRECFAVVWAVRTLRPYVEGTKFTVRTDHDALRWLMSLTESFGRLTRWRSRPTSFWEKNEDFDAVDIERAEQPEVGAPASAVAPPQDDLLAPLTLEEIAEEQRVDDFCQTVLARQSESRDSAFFEDHHGMLKRRHPLDPDLVQIVVPRTLQARLLQLCHAPTIAGHPGQNRMYFALCREYYWPHLAADVAATGRGYRTCAMNRVKLRKHLNRWRLFPATRPLESLAIDILGPLQKMKAGKQFLLVITDRFTKLTQVMTLRTVTAYTVAVAFCDAWVFKYGVPRSLLSDNGPQFNAKFLHSTCRFLGMTNLYTSAYHPQTNGQVERYNRTIGSMLCNYVGENQEDWDVYVGPLTYAYNYHVHRTTRTTPFELVPSRPPPKFSLRKADSDAPPSDRRSQRAEFLRTLDDTMKKAYASLRQTQARYKRDFDKRVRRIHARLKPRNYVYLNPADGAKTSNKLASPAVCPYRVLANDKRTITIDRDGVTERISADRCVYAPPPTDAPRTSKTTPGDLTDRAHAVRCRATTPASGHGGREYGVSHQVGGL
ncbi:unnamed protein product [Chondrus crispus]|uniref:Integrase catalytic domain-containing protein n=1 Tax=Chondrus crispus TaxID=2769 RepID=R7QHN0_CHOCR|nr:unnamed protein product [Chondrus crispus]CDF38002.1 unnamed protein product [Chondrus crispus]|eukprot:XP_005717871.1 unnamed protein product [Chondrus crispus]